MESLEADNTSTISGSGNTNIQKSQNNSMLLGNPHSRQGRVEILIKLNLMLHKKEEKWCEVRALKVSCVSGWKTCSAVEWGGWKWCRCPLTRRSCTGRARGAVHCTGYISWEADWVQKKMCVPFAKDSKSSRLTTDKGESLILRCQGRSNRTGQKKYQWDCCNKGWS